MWSKYLDTGFYIDIHFHEETGNVTITGTTPISKLFLKNNYDLCMSIFEKHINKGYSPAITQVIKVEIEREYDKVKHNTEYVKLRFLINQHDVLVISMNKQLEKSKNDIEAYINETT